MDISVRKTCCDHPHCCHRINTDIIHEILQFLGVQELAVVHAAHPIFQPMLNTIPRQPTLRTNRPRLKFTIDDNQQPVLVVLQETDGHKFACMPVLIVGNSYAARYFPMFWNLLQKSIFADIIFSTGKHVLPITQAASDNILAMFWRIALAIVDFLGHRLQCYKVLFSGKDIFNEDFQNAITQHLVDFVAIPMSDGKI